MRAERRKDSEEERGRGGRGAIEKSAGRARQKGDKDRQRERESGGESKEDNGRTEVKWAEGERGREQSVRAPIHLEFH